MDKKLLALAQKNSFDILNKTNKSDVFEYVTSISNKSSTSSLDVNYRFTFDGNGLGLSGIDQMRPVFELLTIDPNAVSYKILMYLSNSPTAITGGVNYSISNINMRYGIWQKYDDLRDYYVSTYRYIHLLVRVNTTVSQLTKYFLKNIKFYIGSSKAPLVSQSLYNQYISSTESTNYQVFESLRNSPWIGKKIVTFGDSITWYDGNLFGAGHIEAGQTAVGYQSYMREELKCTVINEGMSARNITEMWDEKINAYDFTNIDAVTITSGANDHRENISVGAIDVMGATFNTTTFYGALQATIERIISQSPLTKIYLITPIRGYFNEEGTGNVPNPNAMPEISRDFPDAIKAVGKLYGIPVCDWYDSCGVNDLNILNYLGDTSTPPYYLHPKNVLYKRMANILVPFLKNN